MILFRTLVVLAAAAFVVAFAVATLFPPLTTLAELVVRDDVHALYALHDAIVGHASQWVWDNLATPLLQRPAWLPAVAVGVLCAGGATTLASRPGMPRSHRRRS